MNNKGFMMAEVVVVSSIVLIALAGLYKSYVKIYAIYNERIKYYDAEVLYQLAFYRDKMYDGGLLKLDSDIVKNEEVVLIDKNIINTDEIVNKIDTVYLLPKNELDNLKKKDIKVTFKDYLDYLTGTLDIETEYMMVLERCSNNNGELDIDNCRYAYLEVFLDDTSK